MHRSNATQVRRLVASFAFVVLGCSGSVDSGPAGGDTIVKGTRVQLMPLRNGLVHPRPPATPAFSYDGGPVLPRVKIIEVAWRGNVQFASQLGQFYGAITGSEYFDLLAEYATPTQAIGRGSFEALVTDTAAPAATTVDDDTIQTEIARLISDKAVPPNDESTLYVVHFPPGVTIAEGENRSCVDFCAYHGSFRRNDALVAYAVIPDMGGACAPACGSADAFANTTWAASHEVVQAVTDPAVGFATADPAPPRAWYDPEAGEIADACQGTAQIAGYVVQTQWSAHDGKCRFGASSTGTFVVGVSPSAQTVRAGTAATILVTTAATGPGAATIALTAVDLPEGVTATFVPPSVAPGTSSTLTLAAAASAPTTVADITIRGVAQAETEMAGARLSVEGPKLPNDFALAATPVTQTVRIGDAVTFAVTANLLSGVAEPIALTAGGLPAGASARFSPPSLMAGETAEMTVTTTGDVAAGSALIMITGTARSRTRNATVSLDLATAPPADDFALAVAPPSATVTAGSQTGYTVTTSVVAGSPEPIVLSVGGLPSGVTGSFAPPSVAAGESATLTLEAAAGAPAVNATLFVITGTDASARHSTNAAVAVTPAAQNLIANGDFEVGTLAAWTVTRGNVTNVNINPHGGARSMKVGRSSGVDSTSVVVQDIAVPATGTTTLTFWMYPRCEDSLDMQWVSIVELGAFHDLIASCSDARAWAQHTFDLSRYAGETVTLLFEADVDAFAVGSAWFYVDDVAVTNRP